MAEQTVIETPAPVVETPLSVPDLIKKASESKPTPTTTPTENVDIGFDYKEIEAIKDPIAKDIAIKAYKSMQSGVTKKFQEVANQRKEVEAKSVEIQKQIAEMQTWTPEKVQNYLLNNPSFLQSAQQIAGTPVQNPPTSGLTDEQFSALTDKEKAELAQVPQLKREIDSLKQVNYQAIVAQTDAQLQAKYTDYNSKEVDEALARLSRMQPHELREYVFKGLKHDEHIQSVYNMKSVELNQLNQQKANAISVNGSQAVNNDGVPTRQEGESSQAFWNRLANFRLEQSRKK